MSAITVIDAMPMQPTFELPPAVCELWRFASKDDNRHNLTTVAIFLSEGSPMARAVATDGHRMCVVQFEIDVDAVATRTLIVNAGDLKAYGKPSRGVAIKLKMLNIEKFSLIREGEGGAFTSTLSAFVDATFPDYLQPLPAAGLAHLDGKPAPEVDGEGAPVGFNLTYIGDFAAYLKKVGNRGVGATVILGEPLDATTLTAIDSEHRPVVYVLMPMRV